MIILLPFYFALSVLILVIVAKAMYYVALKQADGFTRSVPSVLVLLGQLATFMFLEQATKDIPVGIVQAL